MTSNETLMLGFTSAFVSHLWWPTAPSAATLYCVLAICVCLIYLQLSAKNTTKQGKILNSIGIFSVGVCFAVLLAGSCINYYLYASIDNQYYNKNIVVEGNVKSIVVGNSSPKKNTKTNDTAQPSHSAASQKFNLSISKIGDKALLIEPTIRLSWFRPQFDLKQGHHLRLFIRLKPPVGLANPHTYNYQQWLASKNVSGLGYVIASPSNQLLTDNISIRQQLIDSVLSTERAQNKWIVALSYGDRSLIEAQDWELLQTTGTAHLFAISGMHLGTVFLLVLSTAKLALLVVCWLTRLTGRVQLQLNNDVRPYLYSIACVSCLIYALLAGFEVPVMRALIAAVLLCLLKVRGVYWRFRALLLTLLSVFFVLFPFAILSLSFWFSFGAVLLVVFFLWRFPYPRFGSWRQKCLHVVKLQIFMSVATTPITYAVFDNLALSAVVANLFMIPIVTFVLVPLCLLAAVLSLIGYVPNFVYSLLDSLFEYIILALRKLDALFHATGMQNDALNAVSYMPSLLFPLLATLTVLMLLPAWQFKRRLVTCFTAVHTVIAAHSYIQESNNRLDSWEIHIFDVGQGSAILVRAKDQMLLYDTGLANANFSMANAVILPFFKAHNKNEVEHLFISHFDIDHAGGKEVIENSLYVHNVYTPKDVCNIAQFNEFALEHLTVEVLWPRTTTSGESNDDSCVVKISDKNVSLLLTGDIEKSSEAQILALYKDTNKLRADIIVAPHHGSLSSSTKAFVTAVSPKYVVFTSGYQNRWGFPHPKVVAQYQPFVEEYFVTGTHGRVRFTIANNQITYSRYRDDEHKRWYFKALSH